MARLHVDFFSDTLQMTTSMEVILPHITKNNRDLPGIRPDGTYPALYLFHGMGDNSTAWTRRTAIERYAEKRGIAVIMPEVYLGWYTDTAYGLKTWTYISQELPEVCRQFFPHISAKREETFAAGLSMGGYGALKCGLLAGDRFSAVASLSGAVNIIGQITAANEKEVDPAERNFWLSIFGSLPAMRGGENDLFAAAQSLAASGKPRPDIYLWCGTEDFLYKDNVKMRDHLTKLGFNLTYEESPGDHQWSYWDEKIQRVLDWLPIQ